MADETNNGVGTQTNTKSSEDMRKALASRLAGASKGN